MVLNAAVMPGNSNLAACSPETFDRIFAEIDAVQPDDLAELCALLLTPEQLSASGVGAKEEVFRAAVERANPALLAKAAA